MKETDAELFWGRVKRGLPLDCWHWMGARSRDGRGIVGIGNRGTTAPRAAWFFTHGAWPSADLFVCHACDVPSCVNPAHLWLGTPRENTRDCIAKGRFRAGSYGPLSRVERRARRFQLALSRRGVAWAEALNVALVGGAEAAAARYGLSSRAAEELELCALCAA